MIIDLKDGDYITYDLTHYECGIISLQFDMNVQDYEILYWQFSPGRIHIWDYSKTSL